MALKVLLTFRDRSLGGTSRSALVMAEAWRRSGAEVSFFACIGVHESRLQDFLDVGPVFDSLTTLDSREYDIVHMHHGVSCETTQRYFDEVQDWASKSSKAPALLTHNVFGESVAHLSRWPGPSVVGLLGHWLWLQYLSNSWGFGGTRRCVLVPNPIDTAWFRPPTASERANARDRLGFGEGVYMLRTGSPIEGKWSSAYRDLAGVLPCEATLVLVGAPPSLAAQLSDRRNVKLYGVTGDAELLRDFYWACDLFVHDSRQGESFGNVIIEALACGMQVVYRNRPFVDNTPSLWGFDRLHVVDDLTAHFRRAGQPVQASEIHSVDYRDGDCQRIERELSISAVSDILTSIHSGHFDPITLDIPEDFMRLPAILVRHNPILFALRKAWRRGSVQELIECGVARSHYRRRQR